MLLPHIPRHPARYHGTREETSGEAVSLGRLAGASDCTLWLDEGGVHFQRPDESGSFLLPRRCLRRAEVRRRGLGTVVDIYWDGAGDVPWVSRFSARRGEDWAAAVEALVAATVRWEHEAQKVSRAPEN